MPASRSPIRSICGSAQPVAVAYANGPEFADYNFTAQEIREYTRRIGGQEFRFTDYVLRGVNTKSPDADDTLAARLRVVPNQAGAHDALLLRLYDEFAFAEDFLGVVKDTTGLFKVTDDKSGAEDDVLAHQRPARIIPGGGPGGVGDDARRQSRHRQGFAGQSRVLGLLARCGHRRRQDREGIHLRRNEFRHRLVPDLAGAGVLLLTLMAAAAAVVAATAAA